MQRKIVNGVPPDLRRNTGFLFLKSADFCYEFRVHTVADFPREKLIPGGKDVQRVEKIYFRHPETKWRHFRYRI